MHTPLLSFVFWVSFIVWVVGFVWGPASWYSVAPNGTRVAVPSRVWALAFVVWLTCCMLRFWGAPV